MDHAQITSNASPNSATTRLLLRESHDKRHTPTHSTRPSANKLTPHLVGTAQLRSTHASYSFSQGGSRSNRGWPGRRHPETTTPRTSNRGQTETQTAPQPAQHVNPKRTLHIRERRKLNLTQSPNLAPIDPVYLNNCPAYSLQPPTVTKPLSRAHYHSPKRRTPRSPRNLTGRPRDFGIRPFRPARASKATPAYPDSKATPQAPLRPITTQKATLAHQRPHYSSLSSPQARLRASPGSGKT